MSRNITTKLLEMMESGDLDPLILAEACLNYMSEHEVADMAESEGLIEVEEDDEDEDESDEDYESEDYDED
jgi:hypothetical protein